MYELKIIQRLFYTIYDLDGAMQNSEEKKNWFPNSRGGKWEKKQDNDGNTYYYNSEVDEKSLKDPIGKYLVFGDKFNSEAAARIALAKQISERSNLDTFIIIILALFTANRNTNRK